MDNWKTRKLFHNDGNQKCIRLSKRYSIAFDVFSFKIFFNTLFGKRGSLWWKTLSFKEKLFNKQYGLAKFFRLKYGYEVRPYHGINWWYLKISFLPLSLNYYFDKKEDDFTVECSQKIK